MSDRQILLLSESFLRAIAALSHHDRKTAESLFLMGAPDMDADIAGAGRRFLVETGAAPAGRADPLPPTPHDGPAPRAPIFHYQPRDHRN